MIIMALVMLFSLSLNVKGQNVSTYSFAQTSGTYTAINGGATLLSAGSLNVYSALTDIGFPFTYHGTVFTNFCASSNGFITLGTVPLNASDWYPIRDIPNSISICGFRSKVNSAVTYTLSGNAPKRVLTIQYPSYYVVYNKTTDKVDAQIKLYEGTNVIQIIYGSSTRGTATGFEVGINGAAVSDFSNRIITGSNNWTTTTAGGANNLSITWSTSIYPASGQTYTWTPPACTYRYYIYKTYLGSSNWCASQAETRNIKVSIYNAGTSAWSNSSPDINVGVKWNTDGSNWAGYYVQTDAGTVAPGDSATYTFYNFEPLNNTGSGYTTPLNLSTNNIAFDMVVNGTCWMGTNPGTCGTGTATMNISYISPNQNIGILPPNISSIIQPNCSTTTGSILFNALPSSGTWIINPGNISGSGTIYTKSGLTPDTYNYTVTDATGCTSASSSNATINNIPSNPTAPVVGTITQQNGCADGIGSVVLSGLPSSGTWTINPGSISGTGTGKTVTGLETGTYNFTVTDANYCTSVPSDNVVINAPYPTPSITVGTITQPTISVPSGSVELDNLPTGNWVINPGNISGHGSSYTITGLGSGIYNFMVTNSYGCTSAFSTDITINTSPTDRVWCSDEGYFVWFEDSPYLTPSPSYVGPNYPNTPYFANGVTASDMLSGSGANMIYTSDGPATVFKSQTITAHSYTEAIAAGDYIYTTIHIPDGNNKVRITKTAFSTRSQAFTFQLAVIDLSTNMIAGVTPPTYYAPNQLGKITDATCKYELLPGKDYEVRWYMWGSSGTIVTCIDNSALNFQSSIQSPIVGTITQPACTSSHTGSVELNGLSANGPWTITQSPGGTTINSSGTDITISGLYAGNKTFTVTDQFGCVSYVSSSVNIDSLPLPPSPTGDSQQVFCNVVSPTVADLIAAGSSIKWYNSSTGVIALSPDIQLLDNSHYYASQTNVDGCESNARLDVFVYLTVPTPIGSASQSFCIGYSHTVADLSASGASIQWFDASSGGTLYPPNTLLTDGYHYYASQVISGCASQDRLDVMVTIISVNPSAPTGSSTQVFCTGNNPTVSNLAATGTSILWYSSSTGGSPLPSGISLVNGNHYYASQTLATCESTSRLDVTVSITTTPDPPNGYPLLAYCSALSPTVADLVTIDGTSIQWYADPSGGSNLAANTPLVDGNDYYASQTVDGCESILRVDAPVQINISPDAPTGDASQTFCSYPPPTIDNLIASGENIQWYDAVSGGNLLDGSTSLVDGLHYYASQTNDDGCESADLLNVAVTINVSPIEPIVTSSQTFCYNNYPTVADLIQPSGTNIQWYDDNDDGVLSLTDNLNDGYNYYATQTVGGCESAPSSYDAVIVNYIDPPIGDGYQQICINPGTWPKVSNIVVTGSNVIWYDSYSGGNILPDTTSLVDGTDYYASQTVNGCESGDRLDVYENIFL